MSSAITGWEHPDPLVSAAEREGKRREEQAERRKGMEVGSRLGVPAP